MLCARCLRIKKYHRSACWQQDYVRTWITNFWSGEQNTRKPLLILFLSSTLSCTKPHLRSHRGTAAISIFLSDVAKTLDVFIPSMKRGLSQGSSRCHEAVDDEQVYISAPSTDCNTVFDEIPTVSTPDPILKSFQLLLIWLWKSRIGVFRPLWAKPKTCYRLEYCQFRCVGTPNHALVSGS